MYHNYEYAVEVRLPNGATQTYRNRVNNMRSEAEVRAMIRSRYSNIVSIDIWEV